MPAKQQMRYAGTPVPAEAKPTGKKRGRPATPLADKVLARLRADLARNQAEYAKIENYEGSSWLFTQESYLLTLSRLEAAIAKVEADGLPDNFDPVKAGL